MRTARTDYRSLVVGWLFHRFCMRRQTDRHNSNIFILSPTGQLTLEWVTIYLDFSVPSYGHFRLIHMNTSSAISCKQVAHTVVIDLRTAQAEQFRNIVRFLIAESLHAFAGGALNHMNPRSADDVCNSVAKWRRRFGTLRPFWLWDALSPSVSWIAGSFASLFMFFVCFFVLLFFPVSRILASSLMPAFLDLPC